MFRRLLLLLALFGAGMSHGLTLDEARALAIGDSDARIAALMVGDLDPDGAARLLDEA